MLPCFLAFHTPICIRYPVESLGWSRHSGGFDAFPYKMAGNPVLSSGFPRQEPVTLAFLNVVGLYVKPVYKDSVENLEYYHETFFIGMSIIGG